MNAIQITETLQNNFIRYLLTTFNVARSEPELASEIQRKFKSSGTLFRGPFLELNPPYAVGRSVRQLSDKGIIHESFCRLREDIHPLRDRPLPPDRPLYKHQERAVRQVISEHHNIVVASGTGSGKTECFLIPVINDLLCDSTDGVRALLIYPMNALVNDQLLRLRKLLKGTDITFGRYTSELEQKEDEGRKKDRNALVNEVVSREVIRGRRGQAPKPPQILITNYAMLEYLLLRPEDSPIFDSGLWRFLCLDEAHTYTGAQGIEVSMLLRRLKHRLGKRRGQMRCIATSATLTDDRQAAAKFASNLFGEDFAEDDVIFGEAASFEASPQITDPAPPLSAYFSRELYNLREQLRESIMKGSFSNPHLLEQTAQDLLASGMADERRINAARAEATDGNVVRFLWAVLKANPHLNALQMLMRGNPIELQHAAKELFGTKIDEDRSTEALCHLVELGAMARESSNSAPLLPARYHLFARSPQGVWLCINPQCSGKLTKDSAWSLAFLDKRETCISCGAGIFELTVCRDCGQTFVRAFEREGKLAIEGRYQDDIAGQRYFTWQRLIMNVESDDGDESADEPESSETEAVEVCLRCRCYRENCSCVSDELFVTLYAVTDTNGNPRQRLTTCPRCTRTKQNEIVTPLKIAGNAPLAVLTEELYQFIPPSDQARHKPGEGRKLLTFADSRQGAARYAAYLETTVKDTLHRHLMVRAAQEERSAGRIPDLEELAEKCVRLAEAYGLFGNRPQAAPDAERRRRKTLMRARIAGEFCARTDPRHSLLAMGLVGCDLHFSVTVMPDEALCKCFDLELEAMMIAIQALLDTMRLDKAVTMPEGVRANDEIFGRNTADIHYWQSNVKGKHNWVGQTERQTRFDYVQRILRATGQRSEPDDVKDALYKVWEWLQDQGVFIGNSQTGFQINTARLIFPANDKWYRCTGCFRLTRRLLADNIRLCPSRGCGGELRLYEPHDDLSEDHYRHIFSRKPIGMRVEEHTAQLQPGVGRDYQDGFIRGEISVLSCSTTFELGVDVGELQAVVLNNVPPTVANYRQRAGRAGRRAGGTAFILTYAAARPHDRVFFNKPQEIIAGEVSLPSLAVDNQIISARHLNATLLGHFLRYLNLSGRSDLMRCGSFFSDGLPDGRHLDSLNHWKESCAQDLIRIIEHFFEQNPDSTPNTPPECIDRLEESLIVQAENYQNWLREYERWRDHHTHIANTSTNNTERKNAERMRQRFSALRQRLLDEFLIDFLCREGVLPSYSFPIDVVNLRLPSNRYYDEREADKSLRLERDKKIAIVEYAPGAEVVADKHIWKSVGVVIRQELNVYDYRICRTCRHLEQSPQRGIPIGSLCQVCGDIQIGEAPRYIDPDGFTTDMTADLREAGLQVETGANRSRSFLLAEGQDVEEHKIGTIIRYAYKRNGKLVALNSGANDEGFSICEKCGKHEPELRSRRSRNRQAGHETPWGEKGCTGTLIECHLGHAFGSDTLHLRFEDMSKLSVPAGEDLSFWRSLNYALLEGASIALQIERRDLDGVVRPFQIGATLTPEENYSQEIVLFDSVPGGAGHVHRIAENLEKVLHQALVIAECPECDEETSCSNCLRNYGNQIYWENLKRGPVVKFLKSVIDEGFPKITP